MTSIEPARLRELFLFADLTDSQLAWVAANSDVVAYRKGEAVSVEGEPAECFFVLLEGTMTMATTNCTRTARAALTTVEKAFEL